MASASPVQVPNHSANLACFEVKGRAYALEVAHVREIVRLQEITPLPNAPALIEGVIDLRGTVIPVLDLARLLSQGRADESAAARVVVLEIDGLVIGLWVDAATDVMSVDVDCLEDVPGLATDAGYDAVRSVVRREGQPPVMLLSLETLVERVYRSADPVAVTRGGDA